MAKAVGSVKSGVKVSITFEVDEEEARALDALAGYGDDSAIAAFYAGCGRHYLQPHERGLRKFLSEVREAVSPVLNEADRLRGVLRDAKEFHSAESS